jgi:hypothetical protein
LIASRPSFEHRKQRELGRLKVWAELFVVKPSDEASGAAPWHTHIRFRGGFRPFVSRHFIGVAETSPHGDLASAQTLEQLVIAKAMTMPRIEPYF